jgi:hypothetical protein
MPKPYLRVVKWVGTIPATGVRTLSALPPNQPVGSLQDRFVEIGHELATLLAHKTEFFRNAEHTPDELHTYATSRERVRELFGELAELRGAYLPN